MINNPDPAQILKTAKTILLVDWPNPGVPGALLKAGLTVFGYSPGRYSVAKWVAEKPDDIEGQSIFPLQDNGYVVFRKLEDRPDSVDIVNVYRPELELEGIVINQVLPLGAKVLWLHPPLTSAWAGAFAAEHSFILIKENDFNKIEYKFKF